VCIADFAPGEADRGVGRSFARRLAEQMRRLTAGTDVMVASGGDMEGLNAAQALREGGVPVDALAAAQDRYAADVLVLGRITAYDPYFRPTLGVSAVALDPADGTVRCSASRLWDAASPDVKDGIDKFYRTAARGDEKQYGRQVYLVSPGYFRRFAAHSLARELVRKLSGSRESAGQ
ncbi:MAG: hypothetical protein V5A84_00710, partial [Planctomycetota bacterium]